MNEAFPDCHSAAVAVQYAALAVTAVALAVAAFCLAYITRTINRWRTWTKDN